VTDGGAQCVERRQVLNIHASADGIDFFGVGQGSTTTELQSYSAPALGDGMLEVRSPTRVWLARSLALGSLRCSLDDGASERRGRWWARAACWTW
jgi:hypothetical protein